MITITIAGFGYVGQAYYELLQTTYNVCIVDPKLNNNKIGEEDAVLVCVSTPQGVDGSCDVTNVLSVVSQVDKTTPILIKSTISLAGWDILVSKFPNHSITFSPEFLRANSAVDDVLDNSNAYFGGGNMQYWHLLLEKAYRARGRNFFSNTEDPRELIVAKYLRNAYLATKVSFFNQAYDLCNAAGINYDKVRILVGSDARIGFSHTTVTEERGFGGPCFPKDTAAIVKIAESNNTDLSLVKTAIEYNKKLRE